MKGMKKHEGRWLKTFFIIFLICLTVFIVRYKGYGMSDMTEHMPLVYHDADSENFKNDWFVNSASELNVRKGFSVVVNFLNHFIGNYEIACMILLFLCMLVFSLGFYNVMLLLTKNYRLSLFSIIFPLILYKTGLGGQSFDIVSFIVGSRLAFPIVIWVVYLYLKEKYVLSFFLLGLVSLIHVSLGYLVYGILFLTLIFKKTGMRGGKKGRLKEKAVSVLKSLSFFILFSLTLIPILLMNSETKASAPEKILYIFARFKAPWHFSVFTWPLSFWLWSAFLFILFLIGFKHSRMEEKYKNIFKVIVILSLLYYLAGFIFTELIPLSLAIKINFYRITEFLSIVEFIFISEFSYNKLNRFFSAKEFEKDKSKKTLISLIVLMIIINLFYVLLFSPFNVLNKVVLLGPLVVFILILVFMFFIESRKIRAILIILLVVGLLGYLIYNPLIGRYKQDQEIEDLFFFIRQNTPKDTILLTPPYIITFRLKTERAIVVDSKAFPFNEKGMFEWYDRFLDITDSQDRRYEEGISYKSLEKKYGGLNKEKVLNLKEKYNFSYAIFEKPKNMDFPVVYENKRFVVYRIS